MNAYEATEVENQLEKIGAEGGCEHMDAVESYKQMLLPNGAEPLIKNYMRS
jgi:hypothetical protein